MFSKCANPDCSVEFDPYGGGQFFCFPLPNCDSLPANVHGVKHYWLCEICSVRYSLVQESSAGVSLRPISAEPPGFARVTKRKSPEAA